MRGLVSQALRVGSCTVNNLTRVEEFNSLLVERFMHLRVLLAFTNRLRDAIAGAGKYCLTTRVLTTITGHRRSDSMRMRLR
ncbi:MAG: hypothetical protein ACJ746_27205 [Bryobacteraceae bacterium]